MKKRILASVLSLSLVFACAGCGSAPAPSSSPGTPASSNPTTAGAYDDLDPITVVLGCSASSANTSYTVMKEAADAIHEKSGGKLTINLVWDGNLGNDNELTESCKAGDIQMVQEATSSLANYVPQSGIFDMPGLFADTDHANKTVRAFLPDYNKYLEEQGLLALDISCPFFRGLSSNVKIQSPEDFKDMSIRCAENKYYMEFYRNLGCSPTPLAYSELFMALQQGLVDAQDNPLSVVIAAKFHEVQDYYIDINAISYVFPVLINKAYYDSLDPRYQELLTEFAVSFDDNYLAIQEEDNANALAQADGQIEVLQTNDDIQAAVRAAGEPVWDLVKQDLGEDYVSRYLELADSFAA